MCTTALTACAADCACNAGIAGALECAADAGPSGTMSCFVTAFGVVGAVDPGMTLEGCIVGMEAACGGTATDGGDGGSTTTDGGDGGGSTSDASDAGAGPG